MFVIFPTVILSLLGPQVLSLKHPSHLWPLGNSSLYNDVFGNTKIRHNVAKQCFLFSTGPDVLPYSVLRMDEEQDTCFDVTLDGKTPLQNLTISFYVYPDNDVTDIGGTILHYKVEDREILRVRALANTFLVSFRDEYGISAGTMYIVNFFTPNDWNHVVLSRQYETGRIVVFKNGIEMYNEDDEFSDVIGFPNTGILRLGKSHDEDDEDNFDGNFACVQLYQRVVQSSNLSDLNRFCLPENWKHHFNYYYEDIEDQKCLTEPPKIIIPDPIVNLIVSSTTVTRESQWLAFLYKYGLQDSGKTSGYWGRTQINKIPEVGDDLIGSFNATDKKICARLCMRIDNCQSFYVGGNLYSSNLKECILYDSLQSTFVDNPGSEYYEIND